MKVTEVEIKQGTSKNGKPYTLYQATVDDGRKASSFNPLQVGDEVELKQNGQFWNAELVGDLKARQTEQAISNNDQLDRIEKKLDQLLGNIEERGDDSAKDEVKLDDGEPSLEDIPF